METPPHAWGRLKWLKKLRHRRGNTPTCVGKTDADRKKGNSSGKHPHMRGEDVRVGSERPCREETPPHAWGRQRRMSMMQFIVRNTPTCVGKTNDCAAFAPRIWKHPHMRGEDEHILAGLERGAETPPHAWGRQHRHVFCTPPNRNTPTCVGKTRQGITGTA